MSAPSSGATARPMLAPMVTSPEAVAIGAASAVDGALRDRREAVGRHVPEDQRELVAAQARDHVALAHDRGQATRALDQHRVAGGVAAQRRSPP